MHRSLSGRRLSQFPRFESRTALQTTAHDWLPVAILFVVLFGRGLFALAKLILAARGGAQ